ncbi:hypothetical protein [Halorussus salinus]|uniref:hypothetical protein n=1 Tax=Halorussus salinus TaxID=1364935 RepID=UPI00138F3E63|nr:hypothetical protein [Halorussus salinus]
MMDHRVGDVSQQRRATACEQAADERETERLHREKAQLRRQRPLLLDELDRRA